MHFAVQNACFLPLFHKNGGHFFCPWTPQRWGSGSFFKKMGQGCTPCPIFLKKDPDPHLWGVQGPLWDARPKNGGPKGGDKSEASSLLSPPFGPPFLGLASQSADLAEPDPAWTPKGGPSARAWLELGAEEAPSSSQARAPRSRRRRGQSFVKKNFRLRKFFPRSSKNRGQLFFWIFFLKFLMDIWSWICVEPEKPKIVPKGRFLVFPAKNTNPATNVHQNFKKKMQKNSWNRVFAAFLVFFFFGKKKPKIAAAGGGGGIVKKPK